MGNWVKLSVRVLRRVLASAWMPFAVCIATLLWAVVCDILSSMYPVAMTAVRSDSLVTVAVAGCFLGAHAIGLVFALSFLFRRNWQCLIRLLLIALSLVVFFEVRQKWADYSWKHLRPAIELRIAGKHLARERDRDIEAPEELRSLIHALNRILSLAGAVSLLVAAVLGVLFARRITKPISGVISATKKISEGDYGVRVDTNLKERETHELAESVNHMAASLEEQEYLRRQMTGDIAHELRTPVTNISSYMEMMIDDVMEPTPERLTSCYDERSRLSGLITDLERLESAESGEINLNKEDVELLHLSETILQGFETGIHGKNIGAWVSGEEVHICADRGRISQVMILRLRVSYATCFSGRFSLTGIPPFQTFICMKAASSHALL